MPIGFPCADLSQRKASNSVRAVFANPGQGRDLNPRSQKHKADSCQIPRMPESKKSAEAVGNRLIAFFTKKIVGHRLTYRLYSNPVKTNKGYVSVTFPKRSKTRLKISAVPSAVRENFAASCAILRDALQMSQCRIT